MTRATRGEGKRLAGGAVALGAALVAAAWAAAPAAAEVTTFQQGAAPTKDYAGCVDTTIVGYGWAHDRPSSRPRARTLGNRALIRFDLSAIATGRSVRRAILRLSFAAIPAWGQKIDVYALARAWEPSATWYEYKYLDAKKSDANNWTTFGGDLDQTDYGKGAGGLIDRQPVRGGPFGHVVELDVTPVVAQWVAGEKPNCGFAVTAARGHFALASSEWPMPAFRPALIVEHCAPGEAPKPGAALRLPPEPGPKPALSPLARTAARGPSAGPWTTVRFGKNSNCQYRAGHMCGYAKQDVRYPGNWGWTPRLRVGGTAGDFNHVVMYFDLSAIPADAAIRKATLKAFVDVGNMRVPPDSETFDQTPDDDPKQAKRRIASARGRMGRLMKYSFGLFPILGAGPGPGWAEEQFTFARRLEDKAWTADGGDLVKASGGPPAAVCDLAAQWATQAKTREKMPETWIRWDVTGLVRAWVGGKLPNRGVVIDGRLMGGEMVLFSDEWYEPDRRPYLEVELSPAPTARQDGPFKPQPVVPTGDYWVEAMRKVHARWKGIKGTFAEYGDSITVTMAFWTPLVLGTRKGITPEMQQALETARKYIHKPCWRKWKGPQWGNTGNMTIRWAFDNIDAWQKKMNPEVMVILFGTNDAYLGPRVPIYTEMYAAVVNRCLADGTIPIVTTLPPRYTQRLSVGGFLTVWNFRRAVIAIAKAKKVPLIDLWAEMVRRRPADWDGRLKKFDEGGWKGYNVPTMIARDGIHPSNPAKYRGDWTEEGLSCCGFGLRNYLTLKAWYEVYKKVLTR